MTWGLTPEMVAAVSKIMRLQDLITVASKREVITRFRNTIGLAGRLSIRNQPNHPTDDSRGIAASAIDGLLMGSGDAVSLGAYITSRPKTGNPDSTRNCVSNIRDGGLAVQAAADTIAQLIRDISNSAISGVALKSAMAALAR